MEEHLEKPAETPPVAADHPGDNDSSDEPDAPRYLHNNGSKEAHWKHELWEDVAVGDIVMLRADDAVPADILIVSTSEEENMAFVETKNLDGETNLKSRHAVPELSGLRTPHDLACSAFRIEMEPPIPKMYQMNGAVLVGGAKQPIDGVTVLLRGTVLRNTRWCLGVVLFTGRDSKIVLNSGETPSKRSKVERQMNPQV